MRAGVPASDRQIDSTAEGHRVIDDHDLLVVHGTGGVHSVDREMYAGRGELVEQTHRRNTEPASVERMRLTLPITPLDDQVTD